MTFPLVLKFSSFCFLSLFFAISHKLKTSSSKGSVRQEGDGIFLEREWREREEGQQSKREKARPNSPLFFTFFLFSLSLFFFRSRSLSSMPSGEGPARVRPQQQENNEPVLSASPLIQVEEEQLLNKPKRARTTSSGGGVGVMGATTANANNNGANNAHHVIDEDLHSRQLAVYGRESMRRMAGTTVVISGLGGLGAETGEMREGEKEKETRKKKR